MSEIQAANERNSHPIEIDALLDQLKYEWARCQPFKAAHANTRAWDKCTFGKLAPCIGTVNRGKGFEKVLKVPTENGMMMYFGPFHLENLPTETKMLLFLCDDSLFILSKAEA